MNQLLIMGTKAECHIERQITLPMAELSSNNGLMHGC
jgi:hypothetical protein